MILIPISFLEITFHHATAFIQEIFVECFYHVAGSVIDVGVTETYIFTNVNFSGKKSTGCFENG